MLRLVFLYGPPAAGKFTIASALSRRTGIPLLHNHDIVDIASNLFAFGSHAFVRLRESLWLSVITEAAAAQKSLIFTFTPEHTVRPSLINDFHALYSEQQGRCVFIAITCAEKTCRQRLQAPSREPFSKLQDPELFDQLQQQGAFEFDFPFAPDLIINTDTLQPNEASQLIIRELARFRQ